MINYSSHPYLENIQKEHDNWTKWTGNISLIIKYKNVYFTPPGSSHLLSSPLSGLAGLAGCNNLARNVELGSGRVVAFNFNVTLHENIKTTFYHIFFVLIYFLNFPSHSS